MNNFFAASFLIILVINFNDFYAFSTDEHSIKSPLRVAQCRATCLERVRFYRLSIINHKPSIFFQKMLSWPC